MPIQQPTDDLLIRYLLQEVSMEEAASIAEWLASDNSNLQNFLAFEKVWLLTRFTDSIDIINIDDEWATFKQRIIENSADPILHTQPEVYPPYGQPTVVRRKIRYRIFAAIAIAASIIAIVFIRRFLVTTQAIEKPVMVASNKPKDSLALALRHEVNKTGKPKKILLQDSTVIVLEDKSEVSFTEPFAANYRSITLQGKANFKVAKDKTRPFTVFTDAIATTVLGTVFDVSAYPQASMITVRLYEGKVVVNPATPGPKRLQKSVYLSPGYELVYDKQNALTSVRPFGSVPSTAITIHTGPSGIDNPNIPGKKGSWYMFNNQPLSQVFDQLQEMYKTDIRYRKKDIQKLYFIGQFNREDSLEMILNQIALSNNLIVTKSNNTFIITNK